MRLGAIGEAPPVVNGNRQKWLGNNCLRMNGKPRREEKISGAETIFLFGLVERSGWCFLPN